MGILSECDISQAGDGAFLVLRYESPSDVVSAEFAV